ncbi:MAG: hypothetical protein AAGA23_22510 [Pseudomonadota bacterium]
MKSVRYFGAALAVAVGGTSLAQEEASNWEGYGQARLRADQVEDLPNGDDVDRARFHGLFGARYVGWDRFEFGAAVKVANGTDRNSDNVRFLDNEESDEVNLGEAYLRYFPGADTLVEVGLTPLPLNLTPTVWDHDLRTWGASVQQDFFIRDFDRLSLLAGTFRGMHIDETGTELNAAQVSWEILEGAPKGGAIRLAYLDFDELTPLIGDGRTRTNRVEAGELVNDYELLDLQLELLWPTRFGGLLTQVDLTQNLGADEDDQAARFSLVMGNAARDGGWEVGYSLQRVQREAVMAAFNEDDWWFPSAMRGYMPWVSYGISPNLHVRLAAFIERRDDRPEHLKRLLLDFNWRLD